MSAKHLVHASRIPLVLREAHLSVLRAEGRLRARRRRNDSTQRPLRVLGYTPTYLPGNRAGSEITLHRLLRDARARGHDVQVLVEQGVSTVLDDIEITADGGRSAARALVEWADVVVAQLSTRGRALRLTATTQTPLVFCMQIGFTPRHVLWGDPDLTVFSSNFVRNDFPWIADSLVIHPVVDEADYLTDRGTSVTMVNLSRMKGGHLLPELAHRMPDRHFLAVLGWGDQQIPDPMPPNVTVIGPQDDMRAVYGKTRVLLMPSVYESYGRVCVEAAVSGIPTIAHPSGGVREALGDAGYWVDRYDVDGWVRALDALDDPAVYAERSARARRRFDELDPERELRLFDEALRRLDGRHG